jgi:hypothetical protein
MTLQNLSKILDKYDKQLGVTETQQPELLQGLPFYNFQDPTDTNTFNHAIGLPRKNGQEFPLFGYEQLLFDTLRNHKHVWVKKATGLGITEFMLRYIAWLCVKDNSLKGAQICIVTGPRIDLAIGLIDRIKRLFTGQLLITFDSKETTIGLNAVSIEYQNKERM